MTVYRAHLEVEQGTGINRDRMVWTQHIEAASVPDAAQVANAFAGAFIGGFDTIPELANAMRDEVRFDILKIYDEVVGGTFLDAYVFGPTEATGNVTANEASLPNEVQVVVSRWVNDSLGRPRKQGRIYLGPFVSSLNSVGADGMSRPAQGLMDRCLGFMRALDDNLRLNYYTPVVWSPKDGIGRVVTRYSVDDAWDIQRRRGVDPTREDVADTAGGFATPP